MTGRKADVVEVSRRNAVVARERLEFGITETARFLLFDIVGGAAHGEGGHLPRGRAAGVRAWLGRAE